MESIQMVIMLLLTTPVWLPVEDAGVAGLIIRRTSTVADKEATPHMENTVEQVAGLKSVQPEASSKESSLEKLFVPMEKVETMTYRKQLFSEKYLEEFTRSQSIHRSFDKSSQEGEWISSGNLTGRITHQKTSSENLRSNAVGRSREDDFEFEVPRLPRRSNLSLHEETLISTSKTGGKRQESIKDLSIEGGTAVSSRPRRSLVDARSRRPHSTAAGRDRRDTSHTAHPESPCPEVFSYSRTRPSDGKWYGMVRVTSDEKVTGVRLEIQLDKTAQLLGAWLGEVYTEDNKHYTVLNAEKEIGPDSPLQVKILVRYNRTEIVPPRINTVAFNGKQICPEKTGAVPLLLPLRIKPSNNRGNNKSNNGLSPKSNDKLPNRTGNSNLQNATRPKISERLSDSSEEDDRIHYPINDDGGAFPVELVDGVSCGQVVPQLVPRITHGLATQKGDWPWHAAIYESKGVDLSYICGGSLIGKKIILTAAHCATKTVGQKETTADPESRVVFLGKYNLIAWSEEGAQTKQIQRIYVHPEYNSRAYVADIAILILTTSVDFTEYVRPICLWDGNRPQLSEIEGHEGVVTGWGHDHKGEVSKVLMMAKMPVVSQQDCIWSSPKFFGYYTSDRTFCAGYRNGTTACNGDSGSGIYFPKRAFGKGGGLVEPLTWTLRGMVSLSVDEEGRRKCSTRHYVVFTDIAKFHYWIQQHRQEVEEDS